MKCDGEGQRETRAVGVRAGRSARRTARGPNHGAGRHDPGRKRRGQEGPVRIRVGRDRMAVGDVVDQWRGAEREWVGPATGTRALAETELAIVGPTVVVRDVQMKRG